VLVAGVFVAGVKDAHLTATNVKNFRVGAGNQVAVYGERVAPVANSVNPTAREY
jgi:hypothetical protein